MCVRTGSLSCKLCRLWAAHVEENNSEEVYCQCRGVETEPSVPLRFATAAFHQGVQHNLSGQTRKPKAVHTWINTNKRFVSRLIVKAAFEKECNCYVIRELSERTAKQSSSVWWSAICSNVWERQRTNSHTKPFIFRSASLAYLQITLDEWQPGIRIKCEFFSACNVAPCFPLFFLFFFSILERS